MMKLTKVILTVIALCLYAQSIIDMIKIRKVLNDGLGKKVEDLIPQINKFINRDKRNIVIASIISFILIIFRT